MKIVSPSAIIVSATHDLLELMEHAGRKCYRSEDRIQPGTAAPFVAGIMSKHHESVLEHGSISVDFVCDRGVSHELVRHRLASFSQESTRYCNYGKEKHGGEVTFISPLGAFWRGNDDNYTTWLAACRFSEQAYLELLAQGTTAQEARSVLPNSTKTELTVSANPREWRHVFKMRTSKAAHPQMREIMIPLLHEFQAHWPVLFNDIKENV